jgi:hypothetical protein
MALNGLEKASDAWRQAAPDEDLPPRYTHRFTSPPGLISTVGPAGAESLAGAARPGQAAG